MKINPLLTDQIVLEELGRRLAQHRINLGLTQEDLSDRAGLGKRTIERIEAGQAAQLDTLVRVLRALDLLDRLDTLIPEQPSPRPMDLLKLRKERRRASPRKDKQADKTTKEWTWGDK